MIYSPSLAAYLACNSVDSQLKVIRTLFGLCLDCGSGGKTLPGLMQKEQLPYQKTCRKLSFMNTNKP